MLTVPNNYKYLEIIKDYDNFEFRSPLNVWDIQPQYEADFDKVKVLDVELNAGEIIYIPAYWWYSIKFKKLSSICCLKYRTFMNMLAISPEIVLSLLQSQNIKREIAPKADVLMYAVTVSGIFGRYAATRSPFFIPFNFIQFEI